MGGNGSSNILYSSAGAAESEIGPATFFAATLGAPPRAKMGGMGPTIFFAAALGRPRGEEDQQHFSQRPWGATESEMGGMGPTIFFTAAVAAEGEIGPATFLTAAGGTARSASWGGGSRK